MALTAADVLVETIADWGVEVVFGLPGDGIDPLEPPYPPKITMGQAGRFASALARSGGERARLAWTVLSDRMRHLV